MKTVILIPDKVYQNAYGIYMDETSEIDAPSGLCAGSQSPDDGFRWWGDAWCQDPTDECSIQSWGKDRSGPFCFEQHGSHPQHHGVDPPPSEIIIRGLETVAEGTGSVDLTDFVHIYAIRVLVHFVWY